MLTLEPVKIGWSDSPFSEVIIIHIMIMTCAECVRVVQVQYLVIGI